MVRLVQSKAMLYVSVERVQGEGGVPDMTILV